MARSNIACLQGLELLRCTKLISLKEVSMGIGKVQGSNHVDLNLWRYSGERL
jgi:hypothetical protein